MTDSFFPVFESLCAAAVQYEASDLLLHEGRVPQMRQQGNLVALETAPLDAAFFDGLWQACGAPGGARDFDTSVTNAAGVRFRANLLHQLGKRAAVLRRIKAEIPSLETLGLPAELLRDWMGHQAGIVIVSGPTGSGKSTTLASALEWLNASHSRHVVTIEDPIEFLFTSDRCIFTQREVGVDTESFAEGLRRSLRQDPDVIFVGEIRDSATAMTAIQASETGHLVLATLHSSSCTEAVDRLQTLFPPDERDSVRKTMSAQLLGILCQRLVPAAGGGVALAVEYFTNIGATRKFVAEGKLPELTDIIARSDPKVARTFLAAMADLVKAGRISEETGCANVDNPQELQRVLRGISSAAQSTRR